MVRIEGKSKTQLNNMTSFANRKGRTFRKKKRKSVINIAILVLVMKLTSTLKVSHSITYHKKVATDLYKFQSNSKFTTI